MRMMRYAAKARRLEHLLKRHLGELRERKLMLRNSLADEERDSHLESEAGFARDARDLGAALLTLSSNTVQSIEDALSRLRSGTYGRCVDCDEPIAEARLRALPFAHACVSCQALRDGSTPARVLPLLA